MELNHNPNSIQRLVSFLESLLGSTHHIRIGIDARSREAEMLLDGWVLPDHEASESLCRCAESQKQQLNGFLEKVEKAVKYSRSIREGRNDVSSPWPEEREKNPRRGDDRKVNSTKSFPASKSGLANLNDKNIKGKVANGTSKRPGSNLHSTPSKSLEGEQMRLLCPVHDITQKKIHTVGLAEALDVKGIPPELVTVLKSVHLYINRLRTTNLKNRSESSFVRHLSSVNESRWEKFAFTNSIDQLPTYSSNGICGKIPIFEDESEEEGDISSQTSQFSGVWNPAIFDIASVGALCVLYQNEEIWNLLQMRLQQLQLSHSEWQICDILSCVPLLSNPDSHYPAASLFLKAATALSRLTALTLPVLVKPCRGQ